MKTQLTIGELEISITVKKNDYACLVKFGDSKIDVDYEFEAGQRAILNRAPEDCQPGYPDSITVCGITAAEPLVFEAEGMRLEIDAGQDIFHLLPGSRVEQLEDEILKGMASHEPDYAEAA
ncbi:MAG: hypothetical protein JWQ03_3160 [Variovorax sp.]|nr:hypothetical protein [Variovorax sp.]